MAEQELTPQISIVCGTRDRPESFARFVKSLVASATVPTELIVADACEGPPAGYVKQACDEAWKSPFVARIKIDVQRPRLGVVKGYNRCFEMAEAPFVAWFNDDSELLHGWDSVALYFMDKHPEVGMGLLQWRDPHDSWNIQTLYNIPVANFGIVRREVGNAVGWFDDREVFVPDIGQNKRLTFYGCDSSISFSVINAGHQIVPIPGCRVQHYREQDIVRQQNMREHLKIGHLPGMILSALWGGDEGFKRLRDKCECKVNVANNEWTYRGLRGQIRERTG